MENINSELEIVRKYGRDNCSLEVLVENFSEYDLSLTQLSQVEVNEESVKYLIDVFHELYGIFRETPRRSNLRQVFRVVDKAQYIENKFRKSLYHVIEGLEKEYEESFLQLTKFARANLWQEVSNRRNELDLIADQYNSISDEILSKPLFDHIESDSLQKYLVNMNERDDIESKYKFIKPFPIFFESIWPANEKMVWFETSLIFSSAAWEVAMAKISF